MAEDTKREEKVIKIQAEEGLNKESAQKKLAERTVREITGESAETNSKKVQDTLQIFDALLTGNLNAIIKEKKDIKAEDIKSLYEHILKNPSITDELARIGYGSDQLNVNASMLKDRFDEVIKDIDKNGDATSQEKKEEENNKDKNQQQTEQMNQEGLYPPPNIPQMQDPINTIKNASNMGAKALSNGLDNTGWVQSAFDTVKGAQNIEKTVANTAGNVAGTVAQKGTERVLGNGIVGKTAGKIAKDLTKDTVAAAIITNLNGGLGK